MNESKDGEQSVPRALGALPDQLALVFKPIWLLRTPEAALLVGLVIAV